MAKQIVAPKSQVQGEGLIRIDQKNFGEMLNDPPASEIGENVAYNENLRIFQSYAEGRTGSILWSSTDLPSLKTGISAYRNDDNIVIRTHGPEFEPSDVTGKYFVWPDGDHDEIIEYLDANRVRTRQTGEKAVISGCWTRSRVFGAYYHKTTRQIIIHIDTRVFVTNALINRYDRVYSVSYEQPDISKSWFYEDDNYLFMINGNGVFKIAILRSNPYFYKVNSPVVQTRVTGVQQTERRTFGRRYIASMVRMINGTYHGSRTGDDTDTNVPLLTIEQESGTTQWDQNANDYGEVFTELQPGLGNETYGQLYCDTAGNGINEDLNDWRGINDGTFRLEMNDEGIQEIMVDFTNIFYLSDVPLFIQTAVRQHWPSATVKMVNIPTGGSRFVISTGKKNGYTMTYLLAGIGGTDISNVDAASGCGIRGTEGNAELSNAMKYTDESVIGELVCGPVRNVSPTAPQYHWTHLGLHGPLDSGPDGTDPINGRGNNPEQFIHIDDVPIMKAFTASETPIGSPDSLITLHVGLFSQHDIGNTILYQNGRTTIIQYLCDAAGTRVYTPTSSYAIGEGGRRARQSAVLGSGTVLTCSKVGNVVTLESGNRNLNVNDVRKALFWADGTIDWITGFTDANTVTVLEEGDKDAQGVAIDPTSRKFADVSTDDILRSRRKNFLTNYRFWTSLPEVDLGVIVPGFLVVAVSGENTVYYSPMAVASKYLAGYYNPGYQYDDRIEDDISFLLRLPDKLVVLCARSTWVTATNSPRSTTVPSVGVFVSQLPTFTLVDNIGVVHVGSIQKVDIGRYSMITSEPAHRFFDGFRYSENVADQRVMRVLEKISTFTVSQYDDISGLKIWGAREE